MKLYAQVVEHSAPAQGADYRWVSVEIKGWTDIQYAITEENRHKAQLVEDFINELLEEYT